MRRSRRWVPIVAGVVLLATGMAGCDWPDRTRYVDQVFANYDGTVDVVYRTTTTSTGATIDLRLDIYQPRGDTAAERPVMMWMHGGYWIGGNKSDMRSWAQDSARRGYVGVTVQYRLRSSISEFADAALDAYDDAIAAAQWLEAHAAQYRIDPDAIIAAGYSAGAVNAMNVVFMPPDRGPAVTPVDGAVSISGITFTAPRSGRPPVIMFHGTLDDLVPYATAQSNCDASRAAGNVCQLVTYDGLGHGIASSQQADIRTRSHHFVFDEILIKKGYVAEQLPAAA